jgi:hypothetical protein
MTSILSCNYIIEIKNHYLLISKFDTDLNFESKNIDIVFNMLIIKPGILLLRGVLSNINKLTNMVQSWN